MKSNWFPVQCCSHSARPIFPSFLIFKIETFSFLFWNENLNCGKNENSWREIFEREFFEFHCRKKKFSKKVGVHVFHQIFVIVQSECGEPYLHRRKFMPAIIYFYSSLPIWNDGQRGWHSWNSTQLLHTGREKMTEKIHK